MTNRVNRRAVREMGRSRGSHPGWLFAGMISFCGIAQGAGAVRLEEIVVTATRRNETIQDVPIAVSAITAQDVQARGFTQYADFLNTVPGVFYQDSGPGKGVIRIRGVSSAEGGVPSTTATYFGESLTSVLTNQGGKPNLRLVDIDRIEVLRGPQGTLFGADALAGVVRIIPKEPQSDTFSASAGLRGSSTAHSDEGSYHADGVLNMPLVSDRLALRVVAYKDREGGYIDNDFAGQTALDYSDAFELPEGSLVSPAIAAFKRKDVNTENTWGARAALRWTPSENLTIDVKHAIQDVQLDSEPYVQLAIGEFSQSRGLDAFRQGAYGERLNVSSIAGTYDFATTSLTAISSWVRMDRFANQDITDLAAASLGVPLPWLLRDESDGRLFTQEVRLRSRTEGPLEWIVGAFYQRSHADGGQDVPDFSCPACLPTVLAGQDFAFRTSHGSLFEDEQQSVFGQASYRFAKAWTLGLGARYLEADITSPFLSVDGILAAGSPPPVTVTGSSHEFNPSGYVRFEPTETLTAYVQASRGFRGGQANQPLPDTCTADAQALRVQPVTDPDTLWNYELGVKSLQADGRVSLNAAIYRQEWSGVQLLSGLPCGFAVIVNGGEVTGEGVEFELVAEPTDVWRLNLAVAYNRSEFDSVAEGTRFSAGDRLPDVPRVNGSVGVQRSFHLPGPWSAFIRGDYTYVGDVLSEFGEIDAFDTVNLRLSVQRGPLGVDLFGRNLADERAVLTLEDPALGSHQTLVRPRELGVELRYAFE